MYSPASHLFLRNIRASLFEGRSPSLLLPDRALRASGASRYNHLRTSTFLPAAVNIRSNSTQTSTPNKPKPQRRTWKYRYGRNKDAVDTRYLRAVEEGGAVRWDPSFIFSSGEGAEVGLTKEKARGLIKHLYSAIRSGDGTQSQFLREYNAMRLWHADPAKLKDHEREWVEIALDQKQEIYWWLDDVTLGRYLYVVGKMMLLGFFHPNTGRTYQTKFIGQLALDSSVRLGNLEAALFIDRLEYEAQSDQFDALTDSNAAHNLIEDHVKNSEIETKDWRALVSYVERIRFTESRLSLGDLENHLRLISQAYELVQPGKEIFDGPKQGDLPLLRWQVHTPPWRLLIEIIDEMCENFGQELDDSMLKRLQLLRREARLSAAWDYRAPEMMWELAVAQDPFSEKSVLSQAETQARLEQDVKLPPSLWLLFLNGAAQGGVSTAAWRLGKYHLERYAWWPIQSDAAPSRNRNPEGQIGFEWLELSACLVGINGENKPVVMHNRFAALASLLLLHGQKAEALRILNLSITELEKCLKSIDAAERAGSNATERAKVARIIKSAENLLVDYANDHPETTNPEKLNADVQRILGAPVDESLVKEAWQQEEALLDGPKSTKSNERS